MPRNYSVTFKADNKTHANSKQPQTLRGGAADGLLRHFNVAHHESKLSTTMQVYDKKKILQGKNMTGSTDRNAAKMNSNLSEFNHFSIVEFMKLTWSK